MPTESDAAHSKRVKDYLFLIPDDQFTSLSHKIDPDDPDQMRFFLFYNEIQRARVLNNKGK